jgi:hypothetical protein
MYVYATRETPRTAVDFIVPANSIKLHNWRKHPDLHGWMEALYNEKGGKDEGFNLTPVLLTASDLERLEAAIVDGNLPETDGCFFGESGGSERDDDLECVAKARAALAEGLTVFYAAWW